MEIRLTQKQTLAFDALQDNNINEVLFGGGIAGGKSYLGCFWLIHSCLKYPDTRWVMGRASLKTLRETTFQSFLKVARLLNLQKDKHFIVTSAQDTTYPNSILFSATGSVILMKDLFAYPSDPEMDELGSLEITGAYIDEASQITLKAKNILLTRMRHNLAKYKLTPKILITSNPAKNWMYFDFYQPWKAGLLPDNRRFIQSLITDNPNIDKAYSDSLQSLQGAERERLLLGNWEYTQDESNLIDYNAITNLFRANHLPAGDHYISADIARFGSDKTVVVLWQGWKAKIFTYAKQSTEDTADAIKHLMNTHNIPASRVVCDEDGIGGGVIDKLRCEGFLNGSKAKLDENYKNLKSQCYYKLAEKVNKFEMFIDCDQHIREKITQELEQVKQLHVDRDEKKAVIPKEKVKEILGRSPDYSDALMMRMYFDLVPQSWTNIVG
ncbi:phage terminase large subunit [Niabella sp. 22666]|uniref:phage terminase large subunit n=1 Tax=Niabella sp. 22666 TaxID=3453954 RepID=UPI003F84DB69